MGSNPPPKVAIILVNLNQEHHTRECIKSLQQVTYPNVEIVLIDNGSHDSSWLKLQAEFPSVVFHRLEENFGFCIGNNTGIRMAFERHADYVLVLNNDTIVDKGFIEPLVELDTSTMNVGVQGCKIYFFSQPNILWYVGGTYNIDKALGSHPAMHLPDDGGFGTIQDTDFVTGCMFFVSRKVLDEVGLLDETLFAYYEDTDWSLRIRNRGYRAMYNPNAKIWHKVSATNKIDSPFYLYFTMRNKLLMLRKHSTFSRWFKHLPYLIYFYSRHILRMALKYRTWSGTRAVVLGLIDGLRNYTGDNGKGSLGKVVRSSRSPS